MKILQLVCIGPPETGGMSTVALQTERLMRDRGVEIETRTLTQDAWWRVGHAGMIRHVLRDQAQFDVVHLHLPFFGADAQILFGTIIEPSIKLVITMHMEADVSGWRKPFLLADREFLQPLLLLRAQAVVVASRSYAQTARYAKYVEKAIEIPFAVETEKFFPGIVPAPLVNLPANARVFSFVGAMDRAHHFKGVDVLLQALKQCPEQVQVIFSGDGDLRISYEQQARELGVASRAHFLGRVSDDQLVDVYRSSECFIFPSTSSAEAFGIVAVQALSCGVPVIASDLPGVRDVVEDGVGLRVPPKDPTALANAIQTILGDEEQRIRMGERARTKALRDYSEQAYADQLFRVYTDVCV